MSRELHRVCVFCGSSTGRNPAYAEAAAELGRLLVERGCGLVFGGGGIGLMGVIADAVLECGGEAIGVIPHGLEVREVAHRRCTEMHVVASMHERKALMTELSDAFIALPGGFGTLEELFETITWAQLGIHRHPVGILDVDEYYAPILAQIERGVDEGFIRPEMRGLFVTARSPRDLFDALVAHPGLDVQRWMTPDES